MKKIYYLFVLTILCTDCNHNKTLTAGEGFVQVAGGKVWYKIVGEGNETPIILLHGGPGFPSYYLKPLAKLSEERPVIFIDQLGCGRSDHNVDTSLMHIENYVEQLELFRNTLGLTKFHLYGSSWGTMLATDYYLKYPKCVASLILSSPCLSAKMWTQDADTLITTLPDSLQRAIRTDSINSRRYRQAVSLYYHQFVNRTNSPDIDSSGMGTNEKIYLYMWGPEEFKATGNLRNYDRTKDLKKIKVPTLFMAGQYDEARPSTVRYYQSLVSHSKFKLLKNSGHLSMQDHPEQDIKAIHEFLFSWEH